MQADNSEESARTNETAVTKWFVPLREEMIVNLLSESRVQNHSFAIHSSDTDKNAFLITVKSTDHLDQVPVSCHPDRCKYSMGKPDPVDFNSLSEILANLLTGRMKVKVDDGKELDMRDYMANPIPVKKWFIAGKMGEEARRAFLATSTKNEFAVWMNKEGDFTLGVKVGGLKLCRIFSQKDGYTIDTNKYFCTVEQLISYYSKYSLPNVNRLLQKQLPRPYDCSHFFACMISKRIEELLRPHSGEGSQDLFYQEFTDVQRQSQRNSFTFSDANRTNCIAKNRYKNILPYDHTRVKLKAEGEDDYINANYLEADFQSYPPAYILSQAPMPTTVDDHWRMILQEKVRVIILLTNFVEKETDKCTKYWPEAGDEMVVCEEHVVTVVSEERVRDIITVKLLCTHQEEGSEHEVTVLHYVGWPDWGVPKDCWGIIELLSMANKEREKGHSSFLVHCSAGVGRTGAYVILDLIMNKIKSEGVRAVINIKEEIIRARTQRAQLVSTLDQYKFIHLSLMKYMQWKLGQNSFKLCSKS